MNQDIYLKGENKIVTRMAMRPDWKLLREIQVVRDLYSTDNAKLESERLPWTVRDALGSSLCLEKLPRESASAKKTFLNKIGQQCKETEGVFVLWNKWVQDHFPVTLAARHDALLKVLRQSLEFEEMVAQKESVDMQEATQQSQDQQPEERSTAQSIPSEKREETEPEQAKTEEYEPDLPLREIEKRIELPEPKNFEELWTYLNTF